MQLVCPSNGPRTVLPVCAFLTRIVLSSEPDKIYQPSCENATELTPRVCPRKGPDNSPPVLASQTLIVLSCEPDTIRLPSFEKATERTRPVCPSKMFWIAGQCVVLPDSNDRVFGNCARNCRDTSDSVGENGRADKYMWGALCDMTLPKAVTNLMASCVYFTSASSCN